MDIESCKTFVEKKFNVVRSKLATLNKFIYKEYLNEQSNKTSV